MTQKVPTSLIDDGALALLGSRNRIINGAFDVWQRGTSFASIADSTYSADRWRWVRAGTSATHDVSRSTDVPTVAETGQLFIYSLLADCTTADGSVAAGDLVALFQRVEGFQWSSLAQRACILSFWVKATKTGIYCVSLINSGSDRSFTAEYTVNATNTWERKIIAIAASPSAGTWNYTDGIGVTLSFVLMAGNTYNIGANNTWNSSGAWATANQVNACDSVSNDFRIAGLQLEAGAVATPFERRAYGQELALCQRYYEVGEFDWIIPADTNGRAIQTVTEFKATKRGAPTIVRTNQSIGGGTFSSITSRTDSFLTQWVSTMAGQISCIFDWTADAEL